jgi:putative transposase
MPNYRRHLPHWQPDGAEFFVTWRLYGSLPGERSIGPHWMQDPRVADCVMETLIESEQQWKLCRLSAWVVMPNHVHALLCPSVKLSKVLLVTKSASARRANRLLERCGQRFWQDESFDHWVRDGHERNQIIRYIEWNPVKAALAAAPENWPWSSASRTRPAL